MGDPQICFGKPTIRGHRIWVSLVLGHLAEGWTPDEVVDNFEGLVVDDVRACVAYGAGCVRRGSTMMASDFNSSASRRIDLRGTPAGEQRRQVRSGRSSFAAWWPFVVCRRYNTCPFAEKRRYAAKRGRQVDDPPGGRGERHHRLRPRRGTRRSALADGRASAFGAPQA